MEGETERPEENTGEQDPEAEPRPKNRESPIAVNTSPKTMGNRCEQWQLKMEQLPKIGRGGNLVIKKDHPTSPISLHAAPSERSGLKRDLGNQQTPHKSREAREVGLHRVLRYCRNVRPTWVKFNSKDTKESEWCSRF